MKNFLLIPFVFVVVLCACSPSPKKEKQPATERYTNSAVGWTIYIPVGFKVLSDGRIAANEEKARKAIGAKRSDSSTTGKLVHLVNFQKNQFNLFSATISPVSKQYLKDWQQLKHQVYEAYLAQKIKIDTSSGKETFGNRIFRTFYLKIYGPNGAVLVNQVMYSAAVNGYDFSASINYNNEVDKKLILDAFKKSEFAIKAN